MEGVRSVEVCGSERDCRAVSNLDMEEGRRG